MNEVLLTNQLSKKYKNHMVVNQINMHIEKGDVYGFVGENGAGKTTVIRLITGLIHPTSGDFRLFDVLSTDTNIHKVKQKLSAVVETPSLYLNLTAYENLKMQCLILGTAPDNKIEQILDTIGLSATLKDKKKVKNFSLGMKQRLGIGMALVGNPELIILDEPMNGLDPEGIVEMRELIIKLNKEQGITFLISSHILEELSKVANKYGFIHQGKIIKEITTEELQLECQKSLELKVDNVSVTEQVCKELNYTQYYQQANCIEIFGELDITNLIVELAKKEVKVLSIQSHDEGIEEYYLKLMGGRK